MNIIDDLIFQTLISIPLLLLEAAPNDTKPDTATQAPAGQVCEDTVRVQEGTEQLQDCLVQLHTAE